MVCNLLSRTLGGFISDPFIILAIVVLILGVAFALLSKTIAIKLEKCDDSNYKVSKTYKNCILWSLIIIFIGILVFVVGTARLSGLF